MFFNLFSNDDLSSEVRLLIFYWKLFFFLISEDILKPFIIIIKLD